MASSSSPKMLTLKTSDGEEFVVEEAIAIQSLTIKNMVEEEKCAWSSIIPLPKVSSRCMPKIIEYWKKHAAGNTEEQEVKKFDQEFSNIDEKALLFDLIAAADSLQIKGILNLLCQKVADMINGMTPDQIAEFFWIKKEEEAEVREENA